MIGNLTTKHNVILAPLAGVSNYPFRQICREFGANLTFTEMVSVNGLLYKNDSSYRLLRIRPNEHPIGFQLFGSDPDLFHRIIPEIENLKPDVIDLNFGCPVRKIVSKGAGAALLKDLDRLQRIVELIKSSTTIPTTVKIRIGWDDNYIIAVNAALAAETGGADALTVHGRTRVQGYGSKANWESIAQVKDAIKIPVIGNGDVFSGKAAYEMFSLTNVDGIMIARGVLGRPWLFQEILEYLNYGNVLPEPSIKMRFEILHKHYQYEISEFPEEIALSQMKKQSNWYTHGLPHTAKLRDQIFRSKSYSEVKMIFSEYLNNWISQVKQKTLSNVE